MRNTLFWTTIITMISTTIAKSDEGMWLLNDPPTELLKSRHQFDLTEGWLEHARLASVRFNNGGSGSFVSDNGLILTNHHIGADSLQKLSTPKRDLLKDGFVARNPSEELPCPDLELNVLVSIEDVTAKVQDAVKPGMNAAEAFAARRSVMGAIEKESLEKTGLRSDVVTLYQGGVYHLYRYKKYTEVKLVMAPESGIAAFGGDVDNFEYPRHGLDFCLFRAYENGKPAKPARYLHFASKPVQQNDLVFVTGHPGTTNRLETLSKLIHRRDYFLPYNLGRLRAFEAALIQFGATSPDNASMSATDLHRVANARKAFSGQYSGLLNPKILETKNSQELELRQAAQQEPFGEKPWAIISDAQSKLRPFEKEYLLLERGDAFFSELFAIARHLVRLSSEMQLPSGKRLREYRDSNLESLKFQLFSPAPILPALEQAKLTSSLSFLAEQLGGAHPNTQLVLAQEPPAIRAAHLAQGSKLHELALRKELFEGGEKAIRASNDPMIQLALAVDAKARELRKKYEEEIEEPERQAYADIATVRFKRFGKSVAPDATFTLRLAFGIVKGYELDGGEIPFHTTFGSLYEKHKVMQGKAPFDLPKRWLEKKSQLDLSTPFNFTSTADTIGGNSGSPILNRSGEFVGVNFDRNRHGLVRNFVYTDVQARHIGVHFQAILESLRKVYDAPELAGELTRQ